MNAVHAAARYLCASGALNNEDLQAAIRAYNQSDTYVQHVLDQAARYTDPSPAGLAGEPLAAEAATVADPSGTGPEQCLKPVDVDVREGRTFPVIE